MINFRLSAICSMAVLCGCIGERNGTSWKPILAEVTKIKAIDNHAHPVRSAVDGEAVDDDYDALRLETFDPFPLPVRMRPTNPEYVGIWKAMFNYQYSDMSEPHIKELVRSKRQLIREKSDGFPTWVLDRAGIDVMIANRITMG